MGQVGAVTRGVNQRIGQRLQGFANVDKAAIIGQAGTLQPIMRTRRGAADAKGFRDRGAIGQMHLITGNMGDFDTGFQLNPQPLNVLQQGLARALADPAKGGVCAFQNGDAGVGHAVGFQVVHHRQ